MGLTKTAITRPVFILMLMFAALMIGTISYRSMRVEESPEVNFGVVNVTVVYPGADADTISNLVSRKVEDALAGINGLREVTSTAREGFTSVTAQFELGTNIDVAMNDVRSRVDSIANNLPKDALKPQVTKFDNASQPVMYMAFRNDKLDARDLRDLLDNKIKNRFAQISGVASATISGGDQREIQVQISKDKLLAYGIGIGDVQRAIAQGNLNVPAGRLKTGGRDLTLRLQTEFKDVDEIRGFVFSVSGRDGERAKIVHLSDVATITDTASEKTEYSRLNGGDTVVLALQKTREGNAVQISEDAKAMNSQIEKEYANLGLKSEIIFESGENIKASINDLLFSLIFGIFLVALTVYIFLHNFRGMMIVAIAIPLCLFTTFIALKAAGFTINNLSMMALSLAVGVLVDDAIVVLENIYRHLRMGENPRDAAINGRSEIGLAAIAITMVDVVVFTPIGFMGGIVGQFFKPLALAFVFAVLSSLFVSFTVTPMLAARWYRKGEDMEHVTGRFSVWFERVFGKLARFYGRVLEWALNHRWFVFILGNSALVAVIMFMVGSFGGGATAGMPLLYVSIAIGLIVFIINAFRGYVKPRFLLYGALFGLIFPLSGLIGYGYGMYKAPPGSKSPEGVFKFQFMPESDQGQVSVNVELPPGASLQRTSDVIAGLEKVVLKHPDVKYVLSDVGSQSGGFGGGGNSGSNYGQLSVTLNDKRSIEDRLAFWHPKDKSLRDKRSDTVSAELLGMIGKVPGANVTVSAGSGGFGAPIQMTFISDNRQALVDTASSIKRALQSGVVTGVINPDISTKPGKPEIRALPDRARLADTGLTPAEIGAALRTLYQGNEDAKLRQNGQEYPIRVMLDLKDRDNPDILSQLPVKFDNGRPIALGEVTQLKEAPGVDKIDRRDRREEIRLSADLLPGYAAGSVQAQVKNYILAHNLILPGVEQKDLGQSDAQAREGVFLFSALFLGFILVYMLLASLYDNLLYPAIIQLAQPQAMVGALLALVITDKSLNIVGMIGIICLVGLVGKNAILLVDYTNTLRSRGRNRHDALVEAGPTRLRPIMMTTIALVMGTLPVALALGRGSEFRETIGIAIIGGISLSTVLTLVVIPCSYTIFDDLSNSMGRLFGGRKKRREETYTDRPEAAVSGSEEREPVAV